jgi:hypothetical protein
MMQTTDCVVPVCFIHHMALTLDIAVTGTQRSPLQQEQARLRALHPSNMISFTTLYCVVLCSTKRNETLRYHIMLSERARSIKD